MSGFINIDTLCWELENIMKNNFPGEVTKQNFKTKFNQAKRQVIEQLKDSINDNEITMKEEFNLIKNKKRLY